MPDINQIATAAAKLYRQPTKAAASEQLRRLLQESTLDAEQLAPIYAHYLKTAKAKPVSGWKWLALAMAKKDVRYYLNYIYCDGKRAVATNGHVLHLIPDDHAPGFYNPNGDKVEVDAKFPDFDRLLVGDWLEIDADLCAPMEIQECANGGHYVDLPSGHRILHKYIVDAIGTASTLDAYRGAQDETGDNTIKIEHQDGRIALVMPMHK